MARICRRLDGIPLSIELAAARCRSLGVEQIARELDDRFRLLTGGARTVLARQQTLKASIDWSHELLDGSERAALRRLGVFAGPFDVTAAEAVVSAFGDVDRYEVFDLVDRLAAKSLIAIDEFGDDDTRYRLLETIRHYALDRLADAGEIAAARDAHAEHWATWAESHNVYLDNSKHIQDALLSNLANLIGGSTVGVRQPAGPDSTTDPVDRVLDQARRCRERRTGSVRVGVGGARRRRRHRLGARRDGGVGGDRVHVADASRRSRAPPSRAPRGAARPAPGAGDAQAERRAHHRHRSRRARAREQVVRRGWEPELERHAAMYAARYYSSVGQLDVAERLLDEASDSDTPNDFRQSGMLGARAHLAYCRGQLGDLARTHSARATRRSHRSPAPTCRCT